MNIEDMTIGQIKEVARVAAAMGCGNTQAFQSASPMIGKYCIVRTYSAGVHAGTVVSRDGDIVVLKNSRRLWSWKAKEGVALSGLAVSGLASGKVDTALPEIELIGAIELIPASAKAQESIHGA